jgi:hypothetical protein
VKSSRAQIISTATVVLLSTISLFANLVVGQHYPLSFVDVDGNTISIADGHFTTLVVTTQAGIDKTRTVGDRIPDFCLGNPTYRMITVLVFEKEHSKPTRAILSALMRRRLDSEGHRLQNRYDKLKIAQNARRDVSAVADFGGAISKQLDLMPGAGLFQIFVFGKNGELIKRWEDLPNADELSSALKQN